jgi:hypothetical protein
MYVGIKDVKPLPSFRLLITFENGEERIFNMEPYLDRGIFRDLKNESLFNSVHVSFDTVEWANGADLCPETIYHDSIPVKTGSAVAV